MPQAPDLKRLLATGMQLTENGRSQARQLGSELVAQGRLATEQMSAALDELVERGRQRNEELRQTVRGEVQRQLSTLGLANKDDLAALERQLSTLGLANKDDLAALEGRLTRVAASPTKARSESGHGDNRRGQQDRGEDGGRQEVHVDEAL